jgi:hypothetical protein
MLSIPDQLAKEREERRRNAENDDDDGNGSGIVFGPDHPLFQALMHSGMPGMPPPGGVGGPGMRGSGTRNNPFQFLPNSNQLMDLVMRDFDGARDRDEDDDVDEEEQYDDDDDGDEDSDYADSTFNI